MWNGSMIRFTGLINGAGRIKAANLNSDNRATIVSRNHTEFKPFYLAMDPLKR